MDKDRELLRLASVLHYVLAAFKGFTACVVLLAFGGMGFAFAELLQHPGSGGGGRPPPPELGWVFVGIGVAVFLYELLLVALLVVAGRSLSASRRYTFCIVVAALACLSMPLGTALGVFTLIVLMRPNVRVLFGRPP